MSLALQDTGVNLEEEQNALMGNVDQSHHARPLQQQTTETPFLNLSPLQIKVIRRAVLGLSDFKEIPSESHPEASFFVK